MKFGMGILYRKLSSIPWLRENWHPDSHALWV